MPCFRRARLALLLAPAACTVGPDYARPLIATPAAYRTTASPADRARPAPALATWWRGFEDPTLDRLVARALAQNLDLEASAARLEQSAARARSARAAQRPSATLGASAAVQRASLEDPQFRTISQFPGFDRTQQRYGLDTGVSWELDLFGGLRRATEAARADADAARADAQAARVTIVAEVATRYLTARELQHRLAVTRDRATTLERLRTIVALRFERGIAPRLELRQVEADLAATRAALPVLDADLEAELNRLDVLMGALPGAHRAELAPVAAIPAPPAIALSQGPVDLLRRRPDVIAAERRLAASNARIGEATAGYYPRVSLSAVIGFVTGGVATLVGGDALATGGGVSLAGPLFDFGRVDAAVDAARGGRREALALYRARMLVAVEEVETALAALVRREAQSRELALAEAALIDARGSSRAAYEAGALSLIEVLDAERRLLATQDTLATARAEAARAAVSAFRAIGGGWNGAGSGAA